MWSDRSIIRISLLSGVGTIAALAIALGTTAMHHEPATDWYPIYQRGLADLDQQRDRDALEHFRQVALGTEEPNLHRAAAKAYAHTYADVGAVDAAYLDFQRIDPAAARELLELLADRYLEEGKSGDATRAYQQLIALAPADRNVCLWQYNVAHAALTSPSSTNADKVAKIEDLVHRWRSIGPVLPAAERAVCHDNAAAMSGDLAHAYHRESTKSHGDDSLAFAERLYAIFLDAFPDHPSFAMNQYYYAELLWKLAQRERNPRLQAALWDRVADAFADVLATGRVEPKVRKEAGYAAVLARKSAAGDTPLGEAVSDAMSEREQRLVAACDRYIADFADLHDDDLVSMKFLEAKLYRRHRHFDESIARYQEILAQRRDHETAEMSARLLLDIYDELHRRGDLVALADSLRADKKFLADKPDLARRLARY